MKCDSLRTRKFDGISFSTFFTGHWLENEQRNRFTTESWSVTVLKSSFFLTMMRRKRCALYASTSTRQRRYSGISWTTFRRHASATNRSYYSNSFGSRRSLPTVNCKWSVIQRISDTRLPLDIMSVAGYLYLCIYFFRFVVPLIVVYTLIEII